MKLDLRFKAFGNGSYGLSDAPLAEVYDHSIRQRHGQITLSLMEAYRNDRIVNPLGQFTSLWKRRLLHFVAFKFMFLYLMLVPMVITAFAGFLATTSDTGRVNSGPVSAAQMPKRQNWFLVVISNDSQIDTNTQGLIQRVIGNLLGQDTLQAVVDPVIWENCFCSTPQKCTDFLGQLPKPINSDNVRIFKYAIHNASERVLGGIGEAITAINTEKGGMDQFGGAVVVQTWKQSGLRLDLTEYRFHGHGIICTPCSMATFLDRVFRLKNGRKIRRYFEYGSINRKQKGKVSC